MARPIFSIFRLAIFLTSVFACFVCCRLHTVAQESITSDLLKILDSNSDGELNPYEVFDVMLQIEAETGEKITFKSLDVMLKEMKADQREEIEEMLEDMDENGDGKVQVIEIQGEMRDFARMFDSDKDGVITIEEALLADENLADEMFLSPEEIDEETNYVFEELDSNKDGVLVENEADDELSWDQISEGDADGNQQVSIAEFKAFLAVDNQRAAFEISEDIATMNGVINSDTPAKVLQLIFEHPNVRTIVMQNVPGSIDDEANLRAARYVRKFDFTTMIKSDGSVASGGTDFFLAGKKRIVEKGGKLGIHSWGGAGYQGKDVPKDDPQHQLYLDYYEEMEIPAQFYWRTLEAAPANDIHWMTEDEIKKFKVRCGQQDLHQSSEAKSPIESEANSESKFNQEERPSEEDKIHENLDTPDSAYLLPKELVGEARMIMALLDQNNDLKLQQSELEGDAKQMLRGIDRDNNGVITVEELIEISEAHSDDVHSKLASIDTHENPHRIVDLPSDIHRGINLHFKKYTNVLAPNGNPIHFLAMDGWSDERILRTRKVMEHFLQDVPNEKWGDKSLLANVMADNHATMVLLNDSRDMERVLPDIEQVNLQLQDLRANESPFEGEEDYLQHQTRDAAYEEVFHLIHGSGVIFTMREFDREIRELAKDAATSGLWNYDEPNMPGNHFEYIICVYDNYLDLWKTNPSLMEGEEIGKQPENQSFNGEYKADQRSSTKVADPLGFAMIEKFNPSHISYTAELPVSFRGTFSLAADGGHRYSEKAKHLLNASLRGNNQNNLTGNNLNNRLVGNSNDNILQGNGGDDSLFGGPGNDTAIFRGPKSQYTIRRIGDLIEVYDSMVNRDGFDVLGGVENLKFQDELLTDQNQKP